MFIYFYLFIFLNIVLAECSSIPSKNRKNDLLPYYNSKGDVSKKDNNLKIVSNEPFIIQLGMPNSQEKKKNEDKKEKKRKKQSKKRQPKSLRKRLRRRRDVHLPTLKKFTGDAELKKKQNEVPITGEEISIPESNISKETFSRNILNREKIFKALNEAATKDARLRDALKYPMKGSDRSDATEKVAKSEGTKLKTNSRSHRIKPGAPILALSHSKTPQAGQRAYQPPNDLTASRERLERKIKNLKQLLKLNDSELSNEGPRIRRKIDPDRTTNKIAKMFLTFSAVNGHNEKRKSKCRDKDEDEYKKDEWDEEEKNESDTRILKKHPSLNEERYKVKKWIEHLKSKRSRRFCPCSQQRDEDFPLESKLTKGPLLRETERSSEETYEPYHKDKDYRPRHDSYSERRDGYTKYRYSKPNGSTDNKLKGLKPHGTKKVDLPLEDLELYRSRAKKILQNAEDILDRIREEEEKRNSESDYFKNHLKELTSRIHSSPRNNGYNDLIRIIQKNLGWNPNQKPPTEDNSEDSLNSMKSYLTKPYEKAKELTQDGARQLSAYLLRNMGKWGNNENVDEDMNSNAEISEPIQLPAGLELGYKEPLYSDSLKKEADDSLECKDGSKPRLKTLKNLVSTENQNEQFPYSSSQAKPFKDLSDPLRKIIEDLSREQGKIHESGQESSEEMPGYMTTNADGIKSPSSETESQKLHSIYMNRDEDKLSTDKNWREKTDTTDSENTNVQESYHSHPNLTDPAEKTFKLPLLLYSKINDLKEQQNDQSSEYEKDKDTKQHENYFPIENDQNLSELMENVLGGDQDNVRGTHPAKTAQSDNTNAFPTMGTHEILEQTGHHETTSPESFSTLPYHVEKQDDSVPLRSSSISQPSKNKSELTSQMDLDKDDEIVEKVNKNMSREESSKQLETATASDEIESSGSHRYDTTDKNSINERAPNERNGNEEMNSFKDLNLQKSYLTPEKTDTSRSPSFEGSRDDAREQVNVNDDSENVESSHSMTTNDMSFEKDAEFLPQGFTETVGAQEDRLKTVGESQIEPSEEIFEGEKEKPIEKHQENFLMSSKYTSDNMTNEPRFHSKEDSDSKEINERVEMEMNEKEKKMDWNEKKTNESDEELLRQKNESDYPTENDKNSEVENVTSGNKNLNEKHSEDGDPEKNKEILQIVGGTGEDWQLKERKSDSSEENSSQGKEKVGKVMNEENEAPDIEPTEQNESNENIQMAKKAKIQTDKIQVDGKTDLEKSNELSADNDLLKEKEILISNASNERGELDSSKSEAIKSSERDVSSEKVELTMKEKENENQAMRDDSDNFGYDPEENVQMKSNDRNIVDPDAEEPNYQERNDMDSIESQEKVQKMEGNRESDIKESESEETEKNAMYEDSNEKVQMTMNADQYPENEQDTEKNQGDELNGSIEENIQKTLGAKKIPSQSKEYKTDEEEEIRNEGDESTDNRIEDEKVRMSRLEERNDAQDENDAERAKKTSKSPYEERVEDEAMTEKSLLDEQKSGDEDDVLKAKHYIQEREDEYLPLTEIPTYQSGVKNDDKSDPIVSKSKYVKETDSKEASNERETDNETEEALGEMNFNEKSGSNEKNVKSPEILEKTRRAEKNSDSENSAYDILQQANLGEAGENVSTDEKEATAENEGDKDLVADAEYLQKPHEEVKSKTAISSEDQLTEQPSNEEFTEESFGNNENNKDLKSENLQMIKENTSRMTTPEIEYLESLGENVDDGVNQSHMKKVTERPEKDLSDKDEIETLMEANPDRKSTSPNLDLKSTDSNEIESLEEISNEAHESPDPYVSSDHEIPEAKHSYGDDYDNASGKIDSNEESSEEYLTEHETPEEIGNKDKLWARHPYEDETLRFYGDPMLGTNNMADDYRFIGNSKELYHNTNTMMGKPMSSEDFDDDRLQDFNHKPLTRELKMPAAIQKIMKDLDGGKQRDDISSIQSLDPEKIDHFIGKIDEVEQENTSLNQDTDCKKECACADEIDLRSRKIGRYEIVKDFLHWVKDLRLNRVLSDD